MMGCIALLKRFVTAVIPQVMPQEKVCTACQAPSLHRSQAGELRAARQDQAEGLDVAGRIRAALEAVGN